MTSLSSELTVILNPCEKITLACRNYVLLTELYNQYNIYAIALSSDLTNFIAYQPWDLQPPQSGMSVKSPVKVW